MHKEDLYLPVHRHDGYSADTDTYMPRLTMGIRSEKCVVRRFRLCTNVIECTYTILGSTV